MPSTAQRRFEAEALPHLPALRAAAMRLARSPADADDLVQEALLRAWRFFGSYRRGTDCRAWLLRILRNVFLNRCQEAKRAREVGAEAGSCPANVGRFVRGGGAEPHEAEDAALGRVPSAAVGRALAQLPAEHRRALVLVDAGEMPYADAARIAGCPVGTVMSRVFRARRMMRAFLEREGGEHARSAEAA